MLHKHGGSSFPTFSFIIWGKRRIVNIWGEKRNMHSDFTQYQPKSWLEGTLTQYVQASD